MSQTRLLLRASVHAFGQYGNGAGNALPTPTHLVLDGINVESYLATVIGLSSGINEIKEKHPSGNYRSYLNVSNDVEELLLNSAFGSNLIAQVAMSEISPEWLLLDTTTLDQIKHHAGSIVVSRQVAKVADFLSAWDDALDVD